MEFEKIVKKNYADWTEEERDFMLKNDSDMENEMELEVN